MAPTTLDRHRFGDAGGVTLLEGLLRTASSGGPDIEMARTRCAPGELLERADRLAERLIGGAPVSINSLLITFVYFSPIRVGYVIFYKLFMRLCLVFC